MSHHPRLIQDCPATRIPAGDTLTLPKGTEVVVTQSLGGNLTVRTDEGLFRIARENAGALEGWEGPGEPEARKSEGGGGDFSEAAVWDALRECYDPEIPVNIVDLGLVYDLAIQSTDDGKNHVDVKMTLTAPGCGMGPVIAEDARQKISALPAVASAQVHIVWDPVWTPQMISEAGRRKLGLE